MLQQMQLKQKIVRNLSNESVGLFGLLKLLKDPEVQNVLRFVNSFLQVTAERKNQ